MEDWKQFIKNLIANNYFFTRITNPEEVSSPIVKAINDKEVPSFDLEANDISQPIVTALEKSTKAIKEIKIPEIPEVDMSGVVSVLEEINKKEYPSTDLTEVISVLRNIDEKIKENKERKDKIKKVDYTGILKLILTAVKKDTVIDFSELAGLLQPLSMMGDVSSELKDIYICLEKISNTEQIIIPEFKFNKEGRLKVEVDATGGGAVSGFSTEAKQIEMIAAIEGIEIPAPVGGATEVTLEEVKVNTDVLGTQTDTSKDFTENGTLSARIRDLGQRCYEIANSTSDLFNVTNTNLIPVVTIIKDYVEGWYNRYFPEYAKIVDGNTEPGTFYIGIAPIGSVTTDAVWQAKKVETSGDNVVITWADGNSNFDNQFDAPNSLSYS